MQEMEKVLNALNEDLHKAVTRIHRPGYCTQSKTEESKRELFMAIDNAASSFSNYVAKWKKKNETKL